MGDIIIRFLTAGVIFGIIDALWLVLVANKFYKDQLGSLLRNKPNMIAAILFYLIYLIGLLVFVINPAITADEWMLALGLGALFGFVAYSTYDLTNLSTLKGFTVKLVIVDLAWGTAVTAVVSTLTYFIVTGLFN